MNITTSPVFFYIDYTTGYTCDIFNERRRGHPRVVLPGASRTMYKKLLCWRFKMKMVKSLLLGVAPRKPIKGISPGGGTGGIDGGTVLKPEFIEGWNIGTETGG